MHRRLHANCSLLTEEEFPKDSWHKAINKFLPSDLQLVEKDSMAAFWLKNPIGPNGKHMSPRDLEELSRFVVQEEHALNYAVDWDLSRSLTHPHLGTTMGAPRITKDNRKLVRVLLEELHSGKVSMERLFGRRFSGELQEFLEYMLSPRYRGQWMGLDEEPRLDAFAKNVQALVERNDQYAAASPVQRCITNAQLKEWQELVVAIQANLVLYEQKAQNLQGPAYTTEVYPGAKII